MVLTLFCRSQRPVKRVKRKIAKHDKFFVVLSWLYLYRLDECTDVYVHYECFKFLYNTPLWNVMLKVSPYWLIAITLSNK